eukprot:2399149-Pyramimonas_sp.AAC.1
MEQTALLNVQKRSKCSNPFVVQPGDTCASLWAACSYGYITCDASGHHSPFCMSLIETVWQAGWTCKNGV